MADKSLKAKAIDIKGKKYVLTADRIIYFNENYPAGSITTELISAPTDERVIIKATVIPDGDRKFTGYSQATVGDGYINKTSALENCETSAVGRALAMMGIGVIDSIASVDEIKKATNAAIEQEKPWLSQMQYEGFVLAIEAGKNEEVKREITKYKMKREYKEGLLQALSK